MGVIRPVFWRDGEMKTYRLVRQSAVQTVLSPDDAERMLASGDWLIATTRPKTRMAARMRLLRNRRSAEGWVPLSFWLSPDQVAAVKAALYPGESYAELLIRLVRKQSLL
jgi:hypothetical protein